MYYITKLENPTYWLEEHGRKILLSMATDSIIASILTLLLPINIQLPDTLTGSFIYRGLLKDLKKTTEKVKAKARDSTAGQSQCKRSYTAQG